MQEQVNMNNDIMDLDLRATRKKKFRVLLDDDQEPQILSLNTSDAGIIYRLNEVYPKLTQLAQDAIAKIDVESDEPALDAAATLLKDIDTQMREYIDYLFDSNVSEVCAPSGTMWDPFNGELRFEFIINSLSPLYGSNFKSEASKMSKRMQTRVKKYKKH